jgi:uncharacterized protein YcfJ
MNKRLSVIATMSAVALLSAGASLTASAGQYGHGAQYDDRAQVISSTPVYERVSVPRRECHIEQVASYDERRSSRVVYEDQYRYRDRDYNRGNGGIGPGTVLGAVIGGAIGHQFGNSSGGRDRGTAAGAIIGGLIGNNAENNGYQRASSPREYVEVERVPVTRDVQRCQMVADYREEIRGYDVRYRYNGRDYTTRMDYDPGQTLQVEVGVRPNHRTPTPSYSRSY